jgi:hexosaminidase
MTPSIRLIILAAVFALLLPSAQAAINTPGPALIPQPAKMEVAAGCFTVTQDTAIVADQPSATTAHQLIDALTPAAGVTLKVSSNPGDAKTTITLKEDSALARLGNEGYQLTVTPEAIHISSAGQAGLFYGIQTLRQLLPPQIFSSATVKDVAWTIPCVTIEDSPRFAWRGFMLDSSRHFIAAESIRNWIDYLALHKLNVLHWHLVDDHGWRFESKKYPLLTQIGAWREQPPIGRYGGFYTQQEMRDIVAYATARHINIVPEIEMPGHSRAALASYPNLGYDGTTTEVDHFFDFPMSATRFPNVPGSNVLNAGKEETYQFLEDILTEAMDIFPSTYIHVGGDEVNTGYWNNSPECKAMMKAHHLANGQQLEAYMMKRMETFLNAHGRQLIGWDEILEGGLSPHATVMSWRGTSGGIAAAKSGHDAVMSPSKPLYFDHRQSSAPQHPPGFGGGVETLEEVYNYNPVPKELSPDEAKHIIGAQANLWTCATETDERLQLFGFPRLCALAEIAWSGPASKDYAGFLKRLDQHRLRLDALGINYWREGGHFQAGTWSPNPAFKAGTTFDLPVMQPLAPGQWTVTFNYQKGADALTIEAVELLAADKVVATDAHEDTAGAQHIHNQYTLAVPKLQPGDALILRIKAHVTPWSGGGNGDSTGVILMSQSSMVQLYASEQPLPSIRATTPVTQNRDHATYDWATRHQQVLDHLKTTKPQIVMIGDSITHYWAGQPAAPIVRAPEAWKQAFGDHAVANLGFGWDRTENVLWRIDHGELDGIDPNLIVILIGTNNLDLDTPEQILAGIDAICRRIHEKLPNTRLLVLGILPRKDQAHLKSDLDKVNFLLQTHLHPRTYVDVLDLGNKFRNPDGSFNDKLFSDGLHPNKDGYAVLAGNLKSVLDQK